MAFASPKMKAYFESLDDEIRKTYEIAESARAIGLDPSDKPEIARARDLPARVESLVGPITVGQRIRELSTRLSREEVAFKIAEEIVYGKFGKLGDDEKAADQAVRTALAILNEGVTTSPLEGIAGVKIKSNFDGSNYLAIYFASPIRAAGGTEAAQTVLVGDFVRRLIHLDRYKPTEDEVERFVEEVELYRRRVTHLQYPSVPDEISIAVRNLPIEVTGEPTEELEVSGHRDLPRIGTNKIRGGAILVLNDGIISKAPKLRKIIDKIGGGEGWEWLEGLRVKDKSGKGEHKTTVSPNYKYLSEVIAGRPVFAYPSQIGGFRLRYGRARNTGLAAVGLNPATMIILDNFIAPGTQLAVERPGKGAIALPVDSIEGPIVKLIDGSVRVLTNRNEAQECTGKVKRIIFLGDMLVAYGEFLENNHPLIQSGYCEEWWALEVAQKISKDFMEDYHKLSELLQMSEKRIHSFVLEPLSVKPDAFETIRLSRVLGVPIHPKFNFFWHDIEPEELMRLRESIVSGILGFEGKKQYLDLARTNNIDEVLEKAGIPFDLFPDRVRLGENHLVLLECLGAFKNTLKCLQHEDVYEQIRNLSGLTFRKKAPIYVGARMGRPEKAKERQMKPPVHGLFPVGLDGGKGRSINKAAEKTSIQVEIVNRKCLQCGEQSPYYKCQNCGSSTVIVKTCSRCQMITEEDICPKCSGTTRSYQKSEINIHKLLANALVKTGASQRDAKGVRALISRNKEPELLEKAVLRAKYALYVFKDGTTRYDATDAPLTHFTPKEVGASAKRLTELGYDVDYYGKKLDSDEQLLELKVQDIIIPEACGQYLLKVSKFIDELLMKVYGLAPFYKANSVQDLLGHLVVGLAPHTSVGVIGRVVGFSRTSVCFAHPYWHAAKRRNCDGDEDSIMLALDALINFSRSFLPSSRGGMMDAPLIIATTIDPDEVDDEAHSLDLMSHYPLEFYQKTLEGRDPKEVESIIEIVAKRLGKPNQYEEFHFSHFTDGLTNGGGRSSYVLLKTTQAKIKAQLGLASRTRAVDASDVARRVLQTHLMPDLLGCLRAFTSQGFRCIECNTKYRRVPLMGRCPKCGGKILTTVSKNTVTKYFDLATDIIKNYNVGAMFNERMEMIEQNLRSVFEGKTPVQKRLTEFGTSE